MTAENQYACHDLSVWNKRQKSHLLSQNVFVQSINDDGEEEDEPEVCRKKISVFFIMLFTARRVYFRFLDSAI